MSVPENSDENKINAVDNSEAKTEGVSRIKCSRPTTSTHIVTENIATLPKSSKNNDDYVKAHNELVNNLEGLVLSTESSDDNICKSDWLKARDSLENLNCTKPDKVEVINSKSSSCTSSKEKCLIAESPHSESLIGATKNCAHSVSKVLSWDPWEKLGRKNKKESKAKENSTPQTSQDQNRKDFKSGDEVRPATDADAEEIIESYEYQPYQPKNSRSVEFTNKVMVVYIKEDKVIGEAIEPLKKELDQQIRNKEMRKGHMADIGFGKKRLVNDWHMKK
ncbi:PREDICTED: uncharacterized protein LOC108565403 isoform X2 [Nicrophorus vespilloides]|uniref:Uncharacterized protein LOC108565403 isoform X2 n=1 Tax=Nicrophorus vespilloides TaxID=110193 RepID=A0ABM1N0H3_NICVS|nr:PREDICTED: uncharacterized protein LOC108565403 isoform X2 [Nicrophorus vespilloides]